MKNLLQRLPFLTNLEPGKEYFFDSTAEFSVHEIIDTIVRQYGLCELKVASFSIGETTLRILFNLAESGLVSKLSCLFDISVKRDKLGLLFFAVKTGLEVSLTKNHAKLVIISGENLKAVILTSANLQVNDKNEVGIISTNENYIEYFDQVFDKWFASGLKITANEFE